MIDELNDAQFNSILIESGLAFYFDEINLVGDFMVSNRMWILGLHQWKTRQD